MSRDASTSPARNQRTKAGMDWIQGKLEAIAQALNVTVDSWSWQVDAGGAQDHLYALTLAGGRRKRVVKLFDREEIDQCVRNKAIQEEICTRLTKMITFLSSN